MLTRESPLQDIDNACMHGRWGQGLICLIPQPNCKPEKGDSKLIRLSLFRVLYAPSYPFQLRLANLAFSIGINYCILLGKSLHHMKGKWDFWKHIYIANCLLLLLLYQFVFCQWQTNHDTNLREYRCIYTTKKKLFYDALSTSFLPDAS